MGAWFVGCLVPYSSFDTRLLPSVAGVGGSVGEKDSLVLLVCNPEHEFVGQDDGPTRAKPRRLSFIRVSAPPPWCPQHCR